MTYSWRVNADGEGDDLGSVVANLPNSLRRRLEEVADLLIPAGEGIPAASDVGVGFKQLDRILHSRPDLLEPLRAALGWDFDGDINESMARLNVEDPKSYQALTTVVLAGYYLSDEVRELIGYPGQQASVVTIGYPEYVTEGLLDAVLERGSRYREPPAV